MKGDWLIYCSLLKLLPKRFRQRTFSFKEIKFSLDLSSPPQFSIYRKKIYEPETSLKICSLLEPGDIFIDIGANFGFFTLLASKRVKNSGLVIAIEPSSDAFSDLSRAIRENHCHNVIPINHALSSQSGSAKLVKPWFRQSTAGYMADSGEILVSTIDYIYEKFNKPKIKLIKIDTEGAELLILRGAMELLKEQKPILILEVGENSKRFKYQAQDVYDFLKAHGYRDNNMLDGRQALFTPK